VDGPEDGLNFHQTEDTMIHTMAEQTYTYEHGLTAAEQRAANIRAGEAAAALRDLRRSLRSVLKFRHRATAPPSRAVVPAPVPSGTR
jgi:hypothetical protein